MRIHKYQAWDTINKKMIDGPMAICSGEGGWILFTAEVEGLDCSKAIHPIQQYELREFTGLLDKHGKDIYEGDILTSHTPFDHWGDKLSIVKYENGTWNYSYALQEFADKPESQWEVIGNIYENPELIEES